MAGPNLPQDQLRDACCHLANMIEDIAKLLRLLYSISVDETMKRCRFKRGPRYGYLERVSRAIMSCSGATWRCELERDDGRRVTDSELVDSDNVDGVGSRRSQSL